MMSLEIVRRFEPDTAAVEEFTVPVPDRGGLHG
jgi:hypothetical protein